MKKFVIILLVVVVVSNTPPFKWIIGWDDIQYSNATGTFTFHEINFKDRDYDMCIGKFKVYKDSMRRDTILYRLNQINAIKFWRWLDYLVKDKYRLPYRSWHDIMAIRGESEVQSGFQDF